MALASATTWEMQTGGDNTNGGGFYDRDPGTSVDYSQQTSAQLSLADLACLDTSTTLTSATGGFTAAMVGNLVYIASGTNFVVGWYEITAYTDTNTVTIDRTAASVGLDASAGNGKVGGCLAFPTDAIVEAFVAGNILYVKAGTYTFTENVIPSPDGTRVNPIQVSGYKTTRGDNPTGDDRPLFAQGAYGFDGVDANYWWSRHLRSTSTSGNQLRFNSYSGYHNLYAYNSSGTSNRRALYVGYLSMMVDCEGKSTNGYAVGGYSARLIHNCYLHDSSIGAHVSGSWDFCISGCIIDTCTTGMYCNVPVAINNTIYNCTTGISVIAGSRNAWFLNNIIDSCTTGASSAASYPNDYWDHNNYHGNTADVSNVTKGANATAHDPDFENAASGDFRLKTGSNCLTAGQPITLGTGGNSIATHQGAVPSVAGEVTAVATDPINQQFVR